MSLTCTAYRYSALLCVLTFICSFQPSFSQNLFPNPGFEDINTCAEYHATCATEGWFYLQPTTNPLVKEYVVPKPILGKNLLLLPVFDITRSLKPLVYTMLSCPLQKGEKYRLSFYLNTSRRNFEHIDFCFTTEEPAREGFDLHSQIPSFTVSAENIVAEMKQKWQAVEYEFTATGNEQFCLVGNIGSKRMLYGPQDAMNKTGMVYYFMDEIKLQPLTNKDMCSGEKETLRKIYWQNTRHTEFALINKPAEEKIRYQVFQDTISLPAAYFETGKSELKQKYFTELDSICKTIKPKKISKIDITGHTDNKGPDSLNLQLSIKRAETVGNFIKLKLPQVAEFIFTSGKGSSEPIAGNNTSAGRSRNRRVELVITYLVVQ